MNAKQKNYQSGFGLLPVILVIFVVAAVGFATFMVFKNKTTANINDEARTERRSTENSQNNPEGELVIHNFGLDTLSSINITTDVTRDFKLSGHKGFYGFGEVLPGTPVRHNPNFEFASLKEDAVIVSAIDGVVVHINAQAESTDSEVFIQPFENSKWMIGYDHVINLNVKKGDKVKAGDRIGTPARQNNGLLRFEFQINKRNASEEVHICPSTLLESSIKDSYVQQLISMQNDWEKITGLELYNATVQNPAGCTMKEMTPAYAEGRG